MGNRVRRAVWHLLGALGTGAACTILTIPFTTGDDPAARVVATVLFGCSTGIAAVIGLCCARQGRNASQAAVIAAYLAPFGGALNAILTYEISAWLLDPWHKQELVLVISLALPIGGLPGLAYSYPLARTAGSVCRALALRPRTSGAASRLLFGMGLFAVATTWCALAFDGPHPAWPFVGAALGLAAIACAGMAARDVLAARRLARLERGAHEVSAIDGRAPAVPAIVPLLGPRELSTLIATTEPLQYGAYRDASIARPTLLLPGTPDEVRGRLRAGAAVLGAAALLLGGTAATVALADHTVPPPPPYAFTDPERPPTPEPAPAPPEKVRWAVPVTGPGADEITGIATDGSGNVFVAGRRELRPGGWHYGILTWDPDPVGIPRGRWGLDNPALRYDAWVASYDRNGRLLWEHRLPAHAHGTAEATSIAAAPDGTVFVAGNFQGRIDLGGGWLRSVGGTDVFLAAYSRDGALLWSRRIGGAFDDRSHGLALDPQGRTLAVVGVRSGRSFVESWTASGRRRWRRTVLLGSDWNDTLAVAVAPSGEVVAAGIFADSRDDVMVYRLSPEGHITWTRRFDGRLWFQRVNAVAIDAEGGAWVSGSFCEQIDFGTGALHESRAGDSYVSDDGYVVRLGADGSTRWAIRLGEDNVDSLDGLVPGPEGDLFVVGHFGFDVIAAHLGADGRALSVERLGGRDRDPAWSVGAALLPGGELAVAGGFRGETVLGDQRFTNVGHDDAFVAAIRAP